MARGGARKGAGRPKGLGKYKEPTKAVRIPLSFVPHIDQFIQQVFKLPLYGSREDHISELDLNEYLIKHPATTVLVRVTGNAMVNAGIVDNDMLIVDRSLPPTHGKIVIAVIEGQLAVKRFDEENKVNPAYPTIEDKRIEIWGVVTQVLRSV